MSDWRDAATTESVKAFDAWDRMARRRLGFLAGLSFFTRNNTGGFQIMSRHWPHKLCWDWTIGWHPYRGAKWDGRRRLSIRVSLRYRAVDLWIWFGRIHWGWQDYGHMPALGHWRSEAPKIVWRHQLRAAE